MILTLSIRPCSFLRIGSSDFFEILYEVEGLLAMKNYRARFFEKILVVPKMYQKRPKIARFDIFLYFSQDCFIRFFWYFAWSWGLTISSKWHSGVVWENSRLPKNRAEHTRNWPVFHTCIIFSRLVCYILLIFCMKLRVDKYFTMT